MSDPGLRSKGAVVPSDMLRSEVMECDKHEIIVNISTMIGNTACSLCTAEKIFDIIKYDIAKYILNHEYAVSHGVEDKLVFWLEERSAPERIKELSLIIEKYLR